LNVIPIALPPLRERRDDIPLLVAHFVRKYAERLSRPIPHIPGDLMEALTDYDWPGNVRELQNFIERAVILSPHTILRAPTSELEPFSLHKSPNLTMTGLEEVERDHILRALEASNWVVGGRNGAAERLGMKRTSLVYKMQKLRIIRPASSLQDGQVRQV
jgi:formate hydrogenlyase transcriptional activator